jgi:hypothetical protein
MDWLLNLGHAAAFAFGCLVAVLGILFLIRLITGARNPTPKKYRIVRDLAFESPRTSAWNDGINASDSLRKPRSGTDVFLEYLGNLEEEPAELSK